MTMLTRLLIAAILLFGLNQAAFANSPPTGAGSDTYHDFLVIIIDGSGSMDGLLGDTQDSKKMNVAKSAVLRAVSTVPKTTYVGVFVFSSRFTGWVYPIAPIDMPTLRERVLGIQENGGTPLGASIKVGADALIAMRKAQLNHGFFQLLVITDGEASDESVMLQNAPEVRARRIQFDVIGVGMGSRHTLARMADRYWSANDPISLQRAMKQSVQVETSNQSAAQADIDLLGGLPTDVARAWLSHVTDMNYDNRAIGEPEETVEESPPPIPDTPQPPQQRRVAHGCTASGFGSPSLPISLIVLLSVATLFWTRRRTIGSRA